MADMKAGYKQTDIGIIPEDWDVMPLYQLCDQNNGLVRGPFGGALKKEFFSNSGYKVYTQQNAIYQDEDLGNYYIPEYKYKELSRFAIRPNDFIVSCSGTIGRIHKVSANSEQGVINQALLIIRTNEKITKEFFSFYFRSKKFQSLIIDSTQGGAIQNLVGMSVFKETPIIVPEIEEQKQIAAALSDVDGLIEALSQLIAKKRDMKTAAMQQLLTGKKRLPGFDGEWAEYQIKEFTHCIAGGTPSTLVDEYWNGQIRWMSSGELNNKFIYDVSGRITEFGLKSSSANMVPEKCVLIGLAGQGKTRGTAAINFVPLSTNQSIAAIFPSYKHCSLYLYYSLDSRYHELRELSSGGGGRGGLNLSIINKISIPFPSLEKQKAISQILFDIDVEIDALEQRLAKARSLKTGMMQELLTGKTRFIKTNKKQEAA